MKSSNNRHHVLVAHGEHPIPPAGWGPVELVVWQFSERLRRRNIPIHIVNQRPIRTVFEVLRLSLKGKADVVYCHAEKPIRALTLLAKWRKFLLISTTHNPITTGTIDHGARKALRRCHMASHHFVGREDIGAKIKALNPSAICAVQLNAVETQDFKTETVGNGKAVCVGRIQERKRQNDTARILKDSGLECDFVGPVMEDIEISEELRSHLVGPWDRATIHARLCEYSCLILLSRSERQPLVVIEALAAGIPVVLSPNAAWNLDHTKPYIFVVESDEEVVEAVRKAIALRDQYTAEIRKYAEEVFDFAILVDNYLTQVDEWLGAEKVH